MRVLQIIHTMGHGGAENVFRWLTWGLRRRDIDAIAAIPIANNGASRENWITPALEEIGIPYEVFDKRGGALRLLHNMKALIGKVKPDIVHSHLLDSNFYSSLVCKWISVPHVCTEHGDVSLKNFLASKTKFVSVSFFSKRVVCVSEAVRKRASALCIFPQKLDLVYNGVRFVDDSVPSLFRKELGIPGDSLIIGCIGNLYPVKGQKFLIQAFSRFFKDNTNSYLVLVGRGQEEGPLRKEAVELGIPEGRICFTGFRDDIVNILKSIDIYVQPSLSEGLPLAVLESMSLGIPVIATDVGGVGEILGDNEYGILVDAGSWKAILEGLLTMRKDLSLSRKRAILSAQFVKERFSIDKMTSDYIKIYEKVLGR